MPANTFLPLSLQIGCKGKHFLGFIVVLTFLLYAEGCKNPAAPPTATTMPPPAAPQQPKQPEIKPGTAYRIAIPLKSVKSPNNKGNFTYRLLWALVEPLNSEQKKVTVQVKAMFEGAWQGAFWEENFIVVLGSGNVVAANNPTKDMVMPNRTVEKSISFTIPKSENKIDLMIKGRGNNFSNIPLDLTKPE
ncbi:hypothetical protein C7N43_25035 [Sphingobacteriales bacterium UPWRP_1]|nr:hypothetical protein BVG80_17155 [Sphingobacteriales bacterium TSM_CSM]PSJ74227.1 hypothetical protein C7N43_25035 [Sphingobacteriales bacterium UPWRP_1]